jgi:phospholipid transport system substrate-binding protein
MEAPMFRALSMVVLLMTVTLATPSLSAVPADPAVQKPIEALHQTLLEVMKAGKTLDFAARESKLDPVIRSVFDLPYMTQLVLGRYWKSMSEADRSRVIDVFSRMSIATYASRFTSFDGESFTTLGQDKGPRDTIWVLTRLNVPNGEPVALNYLMHHAADNRWQVTDVYLSGSISQDATLRDEYGAVMQKKKLDGLIEALENKIKQLASPKPGS